MGNTLVSVRCPYCMKIKETQLIQVSIESPYYPESGDPFCPECLGKVEITFIQELKRKGALGSHKDHIWYTHKAYAEYQKSMPSSMKSLF